MTVYIVNATEWRKIILLESSEHIYPAASLPKRKRRFRNGSLKIETLKKKKSFIGILGSIGGKNRPGH